MTPGDICSIWSAISATWRGSPRAASTSRPSRASPPTCLRSYQGRHAGTASRRRGVALSADLGDAPLTVHADPLALRQILINLVANALAATPRGGRVWVTAAHEGADLRLTVEDTGPGISAGEGTGLALVRAMCAVRGGDFSLDSPPGSGARASVRLPTGA